MNFRQGWLEAPWWAKGMVYLAGVLVGLEFVILHGWRFS